MFLGWLFLIRYKQFVVICLFAHFNLCRGRSVWVGSANWLKIYMICLYSLMSLAEGVICLDVEAWVHLLILVFGRSIHFIALAVCIVFAEMVN